jgi:Tfp pilus assembly protein PilV
MVALLLGLAGLAVSVTGLAVQVMPRRFSASQRQQIISWEALHRWRNLRAGQIFPPTLSYELPGYAFYATRGLQLTARRIAIGSQSGCATATEPAAASVLRRQGCQEMLRATYTDATRSLVVTVGVAVMPSPQAVLTSAAALSGHSSLNPGVRPLAFPGTLSAGFGSPQRQLSAAVKGGNYLVLSVAGYSDGRPTAPISSDAYAKDEMFSFANGLARAVAAPLSKPVARPACPGAPGC